MKSMRMLAMLVLVLGLGVSDHGMEVGGAAYGAAVFGEGVDFNGDGKFDLLWRDVSAGYHAATLMDGVTMGSSGWLGGDLDWQLVATPDFNGDGKTDLLWRQVSTGYHAATLMDGTTAGGTGWLGGDLDWQIVATPDFDGDGKSDLLWRQASTGYHTATLMDGLTMASSGWLGGTTDWQIVATLDFNGDGKADLLWRQQSTGYQTATLMDGLTMGSSGWLGGDTDWQIVPAPDLSIGGGDGHSLDAADGSPTDAVYVDNEGEVGIGTSTPDAKLDVQASTAVCIWGTNFGSGEGVYGTSDTGVGVRGYSQGGTGVQGVGHGSATGVAGCSDSGYGGYFEGPKNYFEGKVGIGTTSPSEELEVEGDNPRILVDATSSNPELNLQASGKTPWAMYQDASTGDLSFYQAGDKITFENGTGNVVIGPESPFAPAVKLSIAGDGYAGIRIYDQAFDWGIYSSVTDGVGLHGMGASDDGIGVWGTGGKYGVYGNGGTYGVYGRTDSFGGYAGYFDGNVHITGNVSKGSGSFEIDHPLDPENKNLRHSFVESPDMMNIYNGNVTLDEDGQAIVQLPEYFEALNCDFRYQLTPIGAPGPNLYIAEKISENRFKIAGGKPDVEVSWQVTGVRQDPYALANRVEVEEYKPAEERGYYLHPKAYGLSDERGIETVRNPQVSKTRKIASGEPRREADKHYN